MRPPCPAGFAWLFEDEDCDFEGGLTFTEEDGYHHIHPQALRISPYARQADPLDPTGPGLSDFTRDWEGSWDYYHTMRGAAGIPLGETGQATRLASGKIKSAMLCPLTEVEFFRGSDTM